MSLKKILSFAFLVVLISTVFISCEEEDDSPVIPPLDRGHTDANRFIIEFQNLEDSTTAEYSFYDPDGVGGNSPTVNDTIIFERPTDEGIIGSIRYRAQVRVFLDNTEVTDKITTNFDDYIFCYTMYQTDELILETRNNDPNGKELGNITEWRSSRKEGTNPSGIGEIKITLNYQQGAKENLCNPGIRIIEAFKPYKIQ